MKTLLSALLVTLAVMIRPAQAQENVVWVQIEAQPSLVQGLAAARRYASDLPDVSGFALGGGWYGVVLGPYALADAQRVLDVYRAEGQIPTDSFIQFAPRLGQQFWPIGRDLLDRGAVEPPVARLDTPQTPDAPPPDPQLSDETPAEARQSEALLTRPEREALQIALRWAGYYEAAIDGAFGPGTRGSMASWQRDRSYEETGVLTTAQRAELLADYNRPLTSVGMAMLRDSTAGIEVMLPMAEIRFETYEPPFAHYASDGELGVRVLLISQPGDQGTLFGLYAIMQTLEIVPLDGPRERGSDSFTLEGQNDRITSYTQASLADGHIKGFTLVWPRGDDQRRARVLEEMKASFTRLDGVLDPGAGAQSVQNIDLVSGLQIRKPRIARSGFFADQAGTVVTTSEVVQSCSRITLDGDVEAQVVAEDTTLGIAVLRPQATVAPIAVARLRGSVPRLQSDVAVSGYSFEGVLGAPTLTFGTLSDIKGLRGEPEIKRLALAAQPGDAGGPVLDTGGTVVGMLLPRGSGAQQLPSDVSFAANAQAIGLALADAGVASELIEPNGAVTPVELTRMATGMTTLVSCWE